jgi:hypothetical protein
VLDVETSHRLQRAGPFSLPWPQCGPFAFRQSLATPLASTQSTPFLNRNVLAWMIYRSGIGYARKQAATVITAARRDLSPGEAVMLVVIGPVLTRERGYAFDFWSSGDGLCRGYIYPSTRRLPSVRRSDVPTLSAAPHHEENPLALWVTILNFTHVTHRAPRPSPPPTTRNIDRGV